MIKGMFSYGSMPVLERMVDFTGARQELIANNIANLSTPYFKPTDLDPAKFQGQLRDAMDQRSRKPNPLRRELELRNTNEVRTRDGKVKQYRPQQSNENILFHDQNNRDVERTMQDLVENTLAHRTSIELLKSQFDLLRTAIRERVS